MKPRWRVREQLPEADLLTTRFQVRQISLSIQFVFLLWMCCHTSDLHIYANIQDVNELFLWRMNEDWHVQTCALRFDLFD